MRGIDTTFLLAHELAEIPVHTKARELVRQSSRNGDARFALAPQVLMEFLHVVTDPRRFQKPLPMEKAVSRAEFWWGAKEQHRIRPAMFSLAARASVGPETAFGHPAGRFSSPSRRASDHHPKPQGFWNLRGLSNRRAGRLNFAGIFNLES
ncbi:MAG: hypothetical protein EBS69_10065 [Verrucomicrobia bacterium]|nr:hypothetical protein [Verrucomicrobiota bacterium]